MYNYSLENQTIKLYKNTPWIEFVNKNNIPIYYKEIQFNIDEPAYFIAKCSQCGCVFHSKKSCFNHLCHPIINTNSNRIQFALIYLINWICIKMISINAIMHPFFQKFCSFLNDDFKIPKPKKMRSLIINYSKIIIENLIKNMKSSYVSIMIDGAKRWKHRYISIIIYTRYEYIYYETRQVYRENAEAISNFLNDCMHYLDSHGKKLCSICSDDYTANIKACKFKNLDYKIYRQYCNCHCASKAIGHQFSIVGKNCFFTKQIELALRLLKHLNPPFLTCVRWQSISECTNFIYEHFDEMKDIINKKRKNVAETYSDLLKIDWLSIKNATQIITSFIIFIEGDEMKIELLFLKLYETVSLLKNENTQIANDLLVEFCNLFEQKTDLIVAVSAFLLTYEGSQFWMKNSEDLKEYYLSKGWSGITKYCESSNISVTDEMHQCFIEHLSSSLNVKMDPFEFWKSKDNELSEVACKILSIPCSETPVERLFGGLSFMLDPSSTKMKSDLINAEMTIRMSTIFQNIHNFDGNMLSKLEKSFEFFQDYAFPEVSYMLSNKMSNQDI